jgi:hypothetical protein
LSALVKGTSAGVELLLLLLKDSASKQQLELLSANKCCTKGQ